MALSPTRLGVASSSEGSDASGSNGDQSNGSERRPHLEPVLDDPCRDLIVQTCMATPRERLREAYGFDFPEELLAFWEFARSHSHAITGVLGLSTVGPFDVLDGKFSSGWPEFSMLLHMRFPFDPPEYFSVLLGNTDGKSFGYYSDDPERLPFSVASYRGRTHTNSARLQAFFPRSALGSSSSTTQ